MPQSRSFRSGRGPRDAVTGADQAPGWRSSQAHQQAAAATATPKLKAGGPYAAPSVIATSDVPSPVANTVRVSVPTFQIYAEAHKKTVKSP
jgi:hypothetical protein